MAKKKVKANAFSVFLHEFIDKERRKNPRGPHRSMDQWTALAHPQYQKLTADEKEALKRKAKELPAKVKVVAPKYSSHGVPLEVYDREERELAENRNYMERTVKGIVENGFLENDIKERPLVLIMANYFYKTSGGIYPPAEIAVAKFNFKNGIYQSYHTYVNPGAMTQGYAFEAQDHSARVHRLAPPKTPDVMGEKKYDLIYAGILDVIGVRVGQTFSKGDPNRPCVFIRAQDVEMIESILDQLSNEKWRPTFDVFALELLFNRLKNKVEENRGGDPIRITVSNEFIEQDRYDVTPNIACHFHEHEEVPQHCALSYVTRWFYLFADHICEKIGVPLVAGRHLPANAAIDPPPSFNADMKEDPDDDYKNGGSSADVGAGAGASGGGAGAQNEVKMARDDYDDDGHAPNQNKYDSDSSEEEDY